MFDREMFFCFKWVVVLCYVMKYGCIWTRLKTRRWSSSFVAIIQKRMLTYPPFLTKGTANLLQVYKKNLFKSWHKWFHKKCVFYKFLWCGYINLSQYVCSLVMNPWPLRNAPSTEIHFRGFTKEYRLRSMALKVNKWLNSRTHK